MNPFILLGIIMGIIFLTGFIVGSLVPPDDVYGDWFDEPPGPEGLREMVKCMYNNGIFNFTDGTCRMPVDPI